MATENLHKKEEIDKLPVDTTGAFFATVAYAGLSNHITDIYLFTYNDINAPQNCFYRGKNGNFKRGVKEF